LQRLSVVGLVILLASCTLPGPEARSAQPRNALTAFFVSWFEKDTTELISQLCTEDQERLSRLKTRHDQLRQLYQAQNRTPPKDLIAPDAALYLALGTAPEDPSSLRTRVALMRTSESKRTENSLELASWRLERSQKGHLVCLPNNARADLDKLQQGYEAHLSHIRTSTPTVEPIRQP